MEKTTELDFIIDGFLRFFEHSQRDVPPPQTNANLHTASTSTLRSTSIVVVQFDSIQFKILYIAISEVQAGGYIDIIRNNYKL